MGDYLGVVFGVLGYFVWCGCLDFGLMVGFLVCGLLFVWVFLVF